MPFAHKKTLVAIAALGAAFCATNASAFPQLVNSATPDLTLIVWDSAGNTYLRDLGTTYSAATVATDFASSLNFTADANWSTFLADVGAGSSSLVFDVVSGTTTPSGTLSLVTTLGPTVSSPPPGVPKNSVATLANAWSNFAVANAASTGPNTHGVTGDTTVHGSDISLTGTPGSVSTANWQNGFGSATFPFTYGAVGSSLSFYSLSATAGLGNATWAKLAGAWTLAANGNLTYAVAAVPEPGEWALMLAGLAAIGYVARRRVSARS